MWNTVEPRSTNFFYLVKTCNLAKILARAENFSVTENSAKVRFYCTFTKWDYPFALYSCLNLSLLFNFVQNGCPLLNLEKKSLYFIFTYMFCLNKAQIDYGLLLWSTSCAATAAQQGSNCPILASHDASQQPCYLCSEP